jgi:hypothetical protein
VLLGPGRRRVLLVVRDQGIAPRHRRHPHAGRGVPVGRPGRRGRPLRQHLGVVVPPPFRPYDVLLSPPAPAPGRFRPQPPTRCGGHDQRRPPAGHRPFDPNGGPTRPSVKPGGPCPPPGGCRQGALRTMSSPGGHPSRLHRRPGRGHSPRPTTWRSNGARYRASGACTRPRLAFDRPGSAPRSSRA